MKQAAQYQAVSELLDLCLTQNWPADRLAQDYFKSRRYIGSKDRRFIADVYYHTLRHQLEYVQLLQGLSAKITGRNLVIVYLSIDENLTAIKEIFTGQGYGPDVLTEDEQHLIQELAKHPQAADRPIVLPRCLDCLSNHYPPEFWRSFQSQASFDIRVNRLKANREDILDALTALGYEAQPTPYSPDGIRLARRYPLETLSLYKEGLIEIQDEGSQLISYLCDPQNSQDILDLCAGVGGKTLHLAAMMHGQGRIVATDISASRLQECQKRVKRAGIKNIQILSLQEAVQQTYDYVLIDAPCSGSGTWRRHPELKNRLTADILQTLHQTQADLLKQARHLVKPGGRLVYVTCSFIPSENEEQIQQFLQQYPDFKLCQDWSFEPLKKFVKQGFLKLSPLESQTDGFFGAVLQQYAQ